jgi:hypothetical protein
MFSSIAVMFILLFAPGGAARPRDAGPIVTANRETGLAHCEILRCGQTREKAGARLAHANGKAAYGPRADDTIVG